MVAKKEKGKRRTKNEEIWDQNEMYPNEVQSTGANMGKMDGWW